MSKKRVVVGISGGVDSAVSALLLKQQGYDVVGLFMSNWKETDDNGCCTGEEDFLDVRSICSQIDIPYYSVDFSKEYMDRVFRLFVDEYRRGRTPNPDVLCNREIKFDAFKKFAIELGADYIATGHYANSEVRDGHTYLLRAKDENKDQTYFLNQLTEEQITNVIFPIGNMIKNEVRDMAKKYNLSVAEKKDSTGICFIGEKRFRQFLANYIPMKKGEIVTKDGKVIGEHDGVFYYTIGQRKGLGIGGTADGNGNAWFILDKDVEKNRLIVSQGEDDVLFDNSLYTEGFNFINGSPECDEFDCLVRIRHRQPLQRAKAFVLKEGEAVKSVRVEFEIPQRAIAKGQYAVLYRDRVCLGGGVIGKSEKI